MRTLRFSFVFWNYILYAFCDFWSGFYQRLFVIFIISLLASIDFLRELRQFNIIFGFERCVFPLLMSFSVIELCVNP